MRMMIAMAAAVVFAATNGGQADGLEQGFANPPDSAKPHTWWHWMNGNVTKEGITADLEAMARVGVGGAQIFNVGCGIPAGPVGFFTPEWREMMQHAAQEADRVGVELCLHNCAGWSSSGGPWNTPENAMQQITIGETTATGPSRFTGTLAQPPAKLGYYRDIAVLAFPALEGEDVTMQSLAPKVTADAPRFNGSALVDGKPETAATLPLPAAGKQVFVGFEFDRPFAARSAVVVLGSGMRNPRGVVQVSEDGRKFRDVRPFAFPRSGGNGTQTISLGANPAPARFYRVRFTDGGLNAKQVNVAEISFSPCLRTDDVFAKSGMNMGSVPGAATPFESAVPPGLAVGRKAIVDLTGKMKPDGRLDWNVPPGRWTILRVGFTPTGRENHPAPDGGLGLECDKLSAQALDAHWEGFVQKVVDDLGPLAGAGKPFNNVLIDSYEVGGQNWTPGFETEFLRRRGYDPLPWLVAATGRVVDHPEATERFLWDVRRTIADLFADNYFGRFKELCNQRGLAASIEPYTGPFESLQSGKHADIPMGEFWVRQELHPSLKIASSVGHIYGRPVIGAESFTASAGEAGGRWLADPYMLKALGDRVFCQGINRYIFHRYAMQPWTDRWPGMTMGPWGSHLDRTCTWWEQGRAWMQYIARSQFMLQQGVFVADAAAFCGESAPVQMPAINPPLPAGHDYDGINADVLLNHAKVEGGLLVLDSGVRYNVLSLSQPDRSMTPALLRKLRGFVAEGLTLVGPPPERSPSLAGYPECDGEVRALVAEMWGGCDGKTVTEHRLGKGNVVWGQTMEQVFAGLGLKPDFSFADENRANLAFIHRRDGDADIYFVSNQRDRFEAVDCTFRVAGKTPELWWPDTGRIETAPVWREENGCTTVPLQFDPAGSVFVVFRKNASGDHVVAASFQHPPGSVATPPPGLEILEARYEALDGQQGADVTALLAGQIRDGLLAIRVGNRILGGDPAINQKKQLRVRYVCNGQAAEQVVAESGQLEIGQLPGSGEPSRLGLVVGADGRTHLRAAGPGSVELTAASGKILKAEARSVPEPAELSGAWSLRFPEGWGAPAQVDLPKLVSWTEHGDAGVNYFSGTATYFKEVELPAERFGEGKTLWLDLGRVKNLAEVFVNGTPLGILWKPPFRVDITAAAKTGRNRLEIKITNLWPNRLIGDEQLPPDCEWGSNDAPKAWPQWLLEGKPSPSGRLTFTTWHHWKKGDAPLESGLLGPVFVRTVVEVEAQ